MEKFIKKFTTFGMLVAVLASFMTVPVTQALSPFVLLDISNVSVTPNPLDPYKEITSIEYYLNKEANVRIDVLDINNTYVSALFSNHQEAGWHIIDWNGISLIDGVIQDTINYLPEGEYTYQITAWGANGSSDIERGPIYIRHDYTPVPVETPQISDVSAPNEFEINTSQPWINFHLEGEGNATITVRDAQNKNFIRTIIDQYLYTGDQSFLWDATDYNGNQVGAGEYEIEIQVIGEHGVTDRAYWNITAKDTDYPNYRPEISGMYVSPSTFDPRRENTEIGFSIDETADVLIEVVRSYDGKVIRYIENTTRQAGRHYIQWDGRNDDGRIVDEDIYDVRIFASNNSGSDEDFRGVEVDYVGIINPPVPGPHPPIPGPLPPTPGCAGFRDVPYGNELCEAAEFVRENGIFGGYPDGTFRPEQPINRAEVTKVILEGFKIKIMPPTGTKFGFADVDPFAWYMPYVRTAKSLGIVHGYPNGEFAPQKTMNRAELLKVFLKASNLPIPACTTSPYSDTPNSRETYWYINFVCFSKAFDLMNDTYNGTFSPDMPITRGDVAILFYRFHERGLLSRSLSSPIDQKK